MQTMYEISAKQFWSRVDELRGKTSYKQICEETGIYIETIRGLRSDKKLPNLVHTATLAKYLNCSIDYLVFGTVQSVPSKLDRLVEAYNNSNEHIKYAVDKLLDLN